MAPRDSGQHDVRNEQHRVHGAVEHLAKQLLRAERTVGAAREQRVDRDAEQCDHHDCQRPHGASDQPEDGGQMTRLVRFSKCAVSSREGDEIHHELSRCCDPWRLFIHHAHQEVAIPRVDYRNPL